jgi:His-Xaa-Ser repeat protein HxsA
MTDSWYKRVIDVLNLPTLLAGAVATAASTTMAATPNHENAWRSDPVDPDVVLPNRLNETADDRYAKHGSHRSHGSHGSHRSSSGGGVYTPPPTPTPSRTPTPAPSRAPSAVPSTPPTSTAPATVPSPTPQDLSAMTIRAQAALMRQGYFNGDIDGILGPQTRSALIAFQKAQGLKESGRLDIETLTKLGISIP